MPYITETLRPRWVVGTKMVLEKEANDEEEEEEEEEEGEEEKEEQ